MHPSARGPCSMGMGTTSQMWSWCVSGAQISPTALHGRGGPGTQSHPAQWGEGCPSQG